MRRRPQKLLNSRCRDLLEINVWQTETIFSAKVGFLHRIVRDFLRDNYQAELRKSAGAAFVPTDCLCNITLALFKRLPTPQGFQKHLDPFFGLVDEMMYYLRELELKTGVSNVAVLDEMDQSLDQCKRSSNPDQSLSRIWPMYLSCACRTITPPTLRELQAQFTP